MKKVNKIKLVGIFICVILFIYLVNLFISSKTVEPEKNIIVINTEQIGPPVGGPIVIQKTKTKQIKTRINKSQTIKIKDKTLARTDYFVLKNKLVTKAKEQVKKNQGVINTQSMNRQELEQWNALFLNEMKECGKPFAFTNNYGAVTVLNYIQTANDFMETECI